MVMARQNRTVTNDISIWRPVLHFKQQKIILERLLHYYVEVPFPPTAWDRDLYDHIRNYECKRYGLPHENHDAWRKDMNDFLDEFEVKK